jgi:hypothetical protein
MGLPDLLFKPWLARLLQQRAVCRGILLTMIIVGFGAWMKWPLWPCIFAEVTGLPCPGCGLTRAIWALVHGDWQTSWLFHPFAGFFILVGVLVTAASLASPFCTDFLVRTVEVFERRTRIPAIILWAVVCFGLLRMLGCWYQPPVGDFSGRFSQWSHQPSQTSPAKNPALNTH